MIGIVSHGVHIPRQRLERGAIFQAMGWSMPATMMVANGTRSMANWDEDPVTMAVDAARDCLVGLSRGDIAATFLAGTTLPFADRQNAGIVAGALDLSGEGRTADVTGSTRAGTTALLMALDAVKAGTAQALVAAADMRQAKPGGFYEMWFGDGAAAVLLGSGSGVIAEFWGSFSVQADFVDHYRPAGAKFDYTWEERWVREEGYGKLLPEAMGGLLAKLGLKTADVAQFVYPCFISAEHGAIAKRLGAKPNQVPSNLHDECGETGAAHPLLMLSRALQTAKAGDILVVAGFGQGADALAFQVTPAIAALPPRGGFAAAQARAKTVGNYTKFLAFRENMRIETGIRAEADMKTAMTALWRKRRMLTGLVGVKCSACGTPQFPPMPLCVNPACGADLSKPDAGEDYPFADASAKVMSLTADMLTYTPDPPAIYGMVTFDGGGRFMADFTDGEAGDFAVGAPVRMVFRRRAADPQRGFINYFWKAAPVGGSAGATAGTGPKAAAKAAVAPVRFDGQVVVVTGAGNGLGRVYALEFAKRGAKVVVNDLGGARDGRGANSEAALRVVEEIKALGGEAVADPHSVATPEGGEAIIQTALSTWGRVDVLVANAGILRDKSLAKIEPADWAAVLDVHFDGAFNTVKPAFAAMKTQGFGRIVLVTSASGLYGNFGQANYAAAKMGLLGFMNTVKLEGSKYDIKINTVAPLAASRLTEDVMPPDILAKLDPAAVAPLVLALSSKACVATGQVFNAASGYFNRVEMRTGPGAALSGAGKSAPTAEDVADNFARIQALNADNGVPFDSAMDAITVLMQSADGAPWPAAPKAPGAAKSAAKTAVTGDSAAPPALTPQLVFAQMPSALRKDKAQGLDVVFGFRLSGAKGGDWHAVVKSGECIVVEGKAPKANVTFVMDADDFIALATGRLDGMKAYTTGKLKLEGDMMKGQLFGKLFKLG